MSDIITESKIKSVKGFGIRLEGLPKCPLCNSTALDRDLFSETETDFHDIMFCENCKEYVEIITPKKVS